ncbi:hypothetical protein N7462_008076 [Penicillium macrosclerotiorum]|uniref:uncharacterized protein n=1 Tax=Penicillium macrosclerotiorum TaxID=303699 RepID=UPI0025494C41|nr:uncharacterized protein N7462_008076 [Penicillium macrosclerotiorum]KAJ5679832.1 hypothetical protein N7462_008076 [Penicillium macrosclerotiorum]
MTEPPRGSFKMAYLLPSFFQKRLLKYALSRLGVVDTEALDPDNLGIRWGQRSIVELKDVGLKLEKLATLLHLPVTCELLRARVQLLRITVPADIYSSGIICEASGINVHIRLLPEDPAQGVQGQAKSQASSRSAVPGSEDVRTLPTPSNLAESFLEAEPEEEKEELQAAISSQSQILQSPLRSSKTMTKISGSEMKRSLYRALWRDVAVRVDMELRQDGPSKRQPENKPDLVAGLLSLGEIDIHGVSGITAGPDESVPSREGKRLVSLAGINFGLISDTAVFSNYARFATPASPTTTMQSKESQSSSRAFSPPPLGPSGSDPDLAMTRSTIFEPSLGFEYSSENIADPGMDASTTFSHDGRFSDADSDLESRNDRYLDDSQVFGRGDPFHDNAGYLDSVLDAHFDDLKVESSAFMQTQREQEPESGDSSYHLNLPLHSTESTANDENIEYSHMPSLSAESLHGLRTYKSPQESSSRLSTHATLQNSTYLNDEEYNSTPRMSAFSNTFQASAPPSESGSAVSEGTASNADLMESKYFSHDEAQSLYMSAMTQGDFSESFVPNMPGAWDSSDSGDKAKNASESMNKDFGPNDDNNPIPGSQDEATPSTPKLTATTDSHFAEEQSSEENQTSSQYLSTDKASTSPYPLQKATETRKPIFYVDKILIWLPSLIEEETAEFASPKIPTERTDSDLKDLMRGLRDPVPDASLPASKSASSTRLNKTMNDSPPMSERDRPAQQHGHLIKNANDLEVEVFSITTHFDISTGWLLLKACQRASAFFEGSGMARSNEQTQPEPQSRQTSFKLDIRKLSVRFLEHVAGNSHSFNDINTASMAAYAPLEDIIFQITASDLRTHFSSDVKRSHLTLDLSKFAFGFASEDLISFNESLKMRESTRDIVTPSQCDIVISLTRSADSVKLDIFTLPIYINLNIQQVEEVLGWMGGLSTILELGSSISSTSTMKSAHKPPKKRSRGVHFETPAPASNKEAKASAPWKVNARIGGIVLDIIGETHYLKLSTTAVKIISRFEGIGIQIDKAKLSGPHPLEDSSDGPGKITLTNIRVEYLFAPKEVDLDRLLTLITPSKDKYDDDDDIMLDTLLRQRRQGSVLRVTVAGMKTIISNTADLGYLSSLGHELGRLSNVTKYLPEDDRPGLLTLTLIREFEARIQVGSDVGDINAHLANVEVAWISMPSLIATQIGTMTVTRNHQEELVGEALIPSQDQTLIRPRPPVLMARFIPDEMDPTFKIKLHHLRVEYTIPSVMAFLGLNRDTTGGELAGEMANSIANLAEHSVRATGIVTFSPPRSDTSRVSVKPTKLAVVFRDSVLGLNPRNSSSKGLVVLTNAKFGGALHGDESSEVTLDIRKASIMIIDNVANVGNADNLHQRTSATIQSNQVQAYIEKGYVPVSSISSATAVVKMMDLADDGTKSLDVELRDDLLILETCADSTQTLIGILNGLQPPAPPVVTTKYRTEILPLQDMLASFSGDAFTTEPPVYMDENNDPAMNLSHISEEDQLGDELEYVSDFYPGRQSGPSGSGDIKLATAADSNDLLDSFHSQYQVSSSITELDFQDDHFARQSTVGGTAHRWDSAHNTYGLSNDTKLQRSPLRVRVRDMHIIWNLFDGYDWQQTRDTISKAVEDVEIKATERRTRASRMSPTAEDEEESVIGDFLFNSIYIGIPANKDPRELHHGINRDIGDLASETGSYATSTTVTGATNRQGRSGSGRERRLRLHRSKHHKMTFELRGVCADLVVFPPDSEETQSSVDVRVKDLEIYDHVPTSTWKKFATYMHEAGERESGTSMVHLEILTVKPIPELAASEIVLKATVLPLRLHVDQDALDFMSRFFEFRDESLDASSTPGDVPFLQRVEVNAVQVKLDFKPKRVDYAGLRSGRTTEFMNFFVLDGADMVLRHVIIYGVSGFDRLGHTLNDIWMPDVKRNQLPGVLAGLAPIRSLVNVGGGVKDLVVIPMREYQKDGRIVRSIQKGALAFAKTTSNELVKLGAKLAIGTQTVLQGAEDLLTSPTGASTTSEEGWDEEEEAKRISLYADQPIGVVQGLRGAFNGLERDLLLARDAIVAVPGEVVESGSAKAAAKAVWKRAPTVILRPAIGVSKAVGQTLLGAGNTLDPSNRRKMEDKYKRH